MFSWGSTSLSTALFTGNLLSDILKKAKPLRSVKYFCMEGADKLVSSAYPAEIGIWAIY